MCKFDNRRKSGQCVKSTTGEKVVNLQRGGFSDYTGGSRLGGQHVQSVQGRRFKTTLLLLLV